MTTIKNEQLIAARKASGKTPSEIAEFLGMSTASYYDCENNDDLNDIVSIGTIVRMCKLIKLDPRELFVQEETYVLKLPFSDIGSSVAHYLKANQTCIEQLEDSVGYEMREILADPNAIYNWNVDCLRTVCKVLACDWIHIVYELSTI